MPGFRRFAFGAGLLGIASVVACAAMVGADVDDVRGESSEDAGHTNVPRDAGSADDAGPVLDAGGACPAGSGLTSCVVGGLDTCVNVTNDPANGDACGAVCSDDPHGVPVCVNGACTYACRGGFSLCDGGDGCCSVASVETDASTNDAAPPPSDLGIPCGNGESSFCESRCPSFGNDVPFCNPAVTGECAAGASCTGVFDGNEHELQTTYHYCQ